MYNSNLPSQPPAGVLGGHVGEGVTGGGGGGGGGVEGVGPEVGVEVGSHSFRASDMAFCFEHSRKSCLACFSSLRAVLPKYSVTFGSVQSLEQVVAEGFVGLRFY